MASERRSDGAMMRIYRIADTDKLRALVKRVFVGS